MKPGLLCLWYPTLPLFTWPWKWEGKNDEDEQMKLLLVGEVLVVLQGKKTQVPK